MLLAVDIGNTNIHCGIFKGDSLGKTFKIRTEEKIFGRGFRPYAKKIERAVIVSVVPEALGRVKRYLRGALRCPVFVVGEDVDSGVKNLYRKPGQVGQDRLVNAKAAFELYGGGAIVVDFGTAITIDVINDKREYLGGIIAPGVELSVGALSRRAALLPDVTLRKPGDILGRETRESMISGAIYGFSSLCDGVVERLKKKCCGKCGVIATGGMASLIGPYCKTIKNIDLHLTLKGLRLIGAEADV
ncbi:MAG: type III pantothenate kinase [Candidatus Omnitrophica bacterium]|nr:type III pantothenate kinase [Candidatus Omnitrophota bacterium]MBU1933552.1 type III pantothenate kinase [Candidatus Omnitrophota bacterium]